MHFLKTVFLAGHVLALPLAELERLGETVLERLAARRLTAIEPGVNLVGFAYGEFGLAESLRALREGVPDGRHSVQREGCRPAAQDPPGGPLDRGPRRRRASSTGARCFVSIPTP